MRLPPGVRRERWEDPDRRKQVEAELGFHLQSKIDDLIAAGLPAEEARSRAMAEFGSVAAVTSRCDEIQRQRVTRRSRLAAIRGFGLEVKATARGLWRSPGYVLVAITTFALGIGSATAVFSLLDGVLLKPLPYQHLDRLIRVWEQDDQRTTGQLTIADLRDYAAEARRFDGFAGYRLRSAVITGVDGEVTQVIGAEVFANFFDLLGIRPRLGRTFLPGEDRDGPGDAVVLGHRIWRDRFGGDTTLVGRTIRLNSVARTVIGVLPAVWQDPIGPGADVWMTSDFGAMARDPARARRNHFLGAIARLGPGVSFESGQAELATLGATLASRHPDVNTGHRPYVQPLQKGSVIRVEAMLLLVAGAVGCLLLITCANVANLVFARALARSREFTLRSALGAGRGRIVRAVLVEQAGLAAAGAIVGLGVAIGLVEAARGPLAGLIPRVDRVAVDGRAFAVATVLAVVAALASGLVPAWLAVGRRSASGNLGARAGLTRRGARGRDALLVVQAALAALLLIGAGLTGKSIQRLLDADLGFVSERVWTFQVAAPPARYPERADAERLRTALLERIRAIPGVIAASASYALPMTNSSSTSILPEGMAPPAGGLPEIGYNAAEGDYFRTLGIPVVEGRTFDARDRADAPPVAVVNRTLAQRFFPGRSGVGSRFKAGPGTDGPWIEVVGVVGDIRRENPALAPVPEAYYPLTQDLARLPSYAVRIEGGDPGAVLIRIRSELKALDAELPLAAVAPLTTIVRQQTRQPETLAAVLVGFGALALLLAAVGIYGVISFLVTERRREIAVRLAVGASGSRVLLETTGRGLMPLAVGLGIGLGAALLSSTAVRRFLYDVAPTDPVVYLLVAVAVGVAGLLGVLVPAVRAARVPPAMVLRD